MSGSQRIKRKPERQRRRRLRYDEALQFDSPRAYREVWLPYKDKEGPEGYYQRFDEHMRKMEGGIRKRAVYRLIGISNKSENVRLPLIRKAETALGISQLERPPGMSDLKHMRAALDRCFDEMTKRNLVDEVVKEEVRELFKIKAKPILFAYIGPPGSVQEASRDDGLYREWMDDRTVAAFYRSRAWAQTRFDFLDENGSRCVACGKTPDDDIVVLVDHIRPVRTHWHLRFKWSNLQVLCQLCNFGKGISETRINR